MAPLQSASLSREIFTQTSPLRREEQKDREGERGGREGGRGRRQVGTVRGALCDRSRRHPRCSAEARTGRSPSRAARASCCSPRTSSAREPKTYPSAWPSVPLRGGPGPGPEGTYSSPFAFLPSNLCTDLRMPSPLDLMASMAASFFSDSSLYCLLRPSTKALKSDSSFSDSASFSFIISSRFATLRAMNSSIFAFFSASQRSRFAGPQVGPRVY